MKKEKMPLEIVIIKVDGDPIAAISRALEPRIQQVLDQHGAYLTMPLVDILRNNARSQPIKNAE